MPTPTRWRDVSKTTRSGLVLRQHRLSIPGTPAEIVLTADAVELSSKQLTRWSVRCTILGGRSVPELTVSTRNPDDITAVRNDAVNKVIDFLKSDLATTELLLGVLPGMLSGKNAKLAEDPPANLAAPVPADPAPADPADPTKPGPKPKRRKRTAAKQS